MSECKRQAFPVAGTAPAKRADGGNGGVLSGVITAVTPAPNPAPRGGGE